jgi:CMD domain protein
MSQHAAGDTADVIDLLVGIAPGSRLDIVRRHRLAARDNAQLSYRALFEPGVPGAVRHEERFALAYFVAGLHGDAAIADFYRQKLITAGQQGLATAIAAQITRGATTGPYGSYPPGPLSPEDKPGLVYAADPSGAAVLGRLAAALAHAHLLVFRPRDASAEALAALRAAGWSTDDIVTLSQLVAFLTFQIRVVIGLRALAA